MKRRVGSIYTKELQTGVTYIIRMARKGWVFSLGFDDYDAADEWIEQNWEDFKEDPEWYFVWRRRLYEEMRELGEKVRDHIRIGVLKRGE